MLQDIISIQCRTTVMGDIREPNSYIHCHHFLHHFK